MMQLNLLRRIHDWLLHRRGMEKLGIPYRVIPQDTPYEKWLETKRSVLPVLDCLYIEDVRSVDLKPWESIGPGISGLYLRLADYQITDGRLLEMPPGGATTVTRHMFEMGVYFLSGYGYTSLIDNGVEARRLEWREGTVVSVPFNMEYQHVNCSAEPARLLAVSSFPLVLNSTGSQDFGDHKFCEFSEFTIQDVKCADLDAASGRGKGVRNRYWTLAGNQMLSTNLSEMRGQSIKRAHRANSDATVLMLSGKGCLVTWPDGAWHKRIRIDFKEGTLIAAPIYWYRQFLNPGRLPARNLTFSAALLVRNLGIRFLDQMEGDLPGIRQIWKNERRRRDSD